MKIEMVPLLSKCAKQTLQKLKYFYILYFFFGELFIVYLINSILFIAFLVFILPKYTLTLVNVNVFVGTCGCVINECFGELHKSFFIVSVKKLPSWSSICLGY